MVQCNLRELAAARHGTATMLCGFVEHERAGIFMQEEPR